MTSNPLARRRFDEPERSLDSHVAFLNGLRWVNASGRPYFVGSRSRVDGSTERFVDRAA